MSEKPCRILIVDDDIDNLANLSDILTDAGFRTTTASDGETALSKVRTKCPNDECRIDLCLLDFKMPGMDGVELFEKIVQKDPGMRAIMITAFAGDDGVRRAEQVGTWKVLRKPVDVTILLGMINEAVA